jgi:hypothetical protein
LLARRSLQNLSKLPGILIENSDDFSSLQPRLRPSLAKILSVKHRSVHVDRSVHVATAVAVALGEEGWVAYTSWAHILYGFITTNTHNT